MGTWKYDQAPTWRPDAIASPEGWRHPVTGELLACCSGGNMLEMRHAKLDAIEDNLLNEDAGFFLMETANLDGTPKALLLD